MRIGNIDEISLSDLADKVMNKLEQSAVKIVGNPEKKIKTIGIVGGSGTSEFNNALRFNCDCFITGEIHHHIALEAVEQEICMIEVNHAVEALFKDSLKEMLLKNNLK